VGLADPRRGPGLRPGAQVKLHNFAPGSDEPVEVVTGYLKSMEHPEPDFLEYSYRGPGDRVMLGADMARRSEMTVTISIDGREISGLTTIKKSEEDDMSTENKITIIRDEPRKAIVVYKRADDAEDGKEQYFTKDGSVIVREPLQEMPVFAEYDEGDFKALLQAARRTPGLWDAAREDFAR
jgi:hypothetical protein